MQETSSNNKRIAKNTLFLYFRMILIMGVTLYTSRVILDKLGVDDYGLYQVVGGVVGMLSFLNGTLSIGTSRFLTYELGTGNSEKLLRTFSTSFYVHLILALIIVLLMETGGLWFLYHKLVIPPERLTACFWVFQLSILTTFVAITQVPYTATIMAHERMGIYAYISIFEAVAKLGVCYLITFTPIDRLVFYAILIAAVQILIALSYRFYSIYYFAESKLHWIFDSKILKCLISFSGWNIMANLTETLKLQGVIVLINLFFVPVIVAAQAIANQVAGAMMQFVHNFRAAINPQIIKLYASGNREASRKLTLETTVYCFDLILLLGLPAIVVMNKLMHLWLVEVPEYAVTFTQWIIIRNIISTFSASLYIPMMAANKIRSNSIAAVFLGIGEFVILYILLRIGFGPMWIQYMGVLLALSFGLIIKPYILYKEIDYPLKDLCQCYWICTKVVLVALLPTMCCILFLEDTLLCNIIKALISAVGVALSSYIFLKQTAKSKLRVAITRSIDSIRKMTFNNYN